eukprot:GEMP01013354.1.p1 GENE.GEMP01013354.1~~GEMP01013354.1.p1  ORF type:complete len:761 (+),score=199.38 GEMP01013354.1:90-2372(+)
MVLGLQREILRWLQSLDLSFAVTNPKRDFANGFMIAEILSRYYPSLISMHTFDNGSRTASKNDNWEQLHLFFKKVSIDIDRADFEPVIQQMPETAVAIVTKLYMILTSRSVQTEPTLKEGQFGAATQRSATEKPTRKSEPTKGAKNEEEPPMSANSLEVMDSQSAAYAFPSSSLKRSSGRDTQKQVQLAADFNQLEIDEVQIKPFEGRNVAALRAQKDFRAQVSLRSRTATSMSGRKSAQADQDPSTPQPPFKTGNVKSVTELMKPIITAVIQDSSLTKSLDPRKEMAVSFMELCRDVIPEATSLRVFSSLTQRAGILVDTMCRVPSEFFKLWQLLAPLLNDFPESSPVFETIINFFRRLGSLMQEEDSLASQQVLLDVCLPTLGQLMENPGKRDALCEITYAFAQPNAMSHLAVLRVLKEQVNLSTHISCLASFMAIDATTNLLDDHLLDLYSYYALVALQDLNPKTRVSGLAILCNVTCSSPVSEHVDSVIKLVPHVQLLVKDSWWEVQAQLLLFASHLLLRMAEFPANPAVEKALLDIIDTLFTVPKSKHVLQVGLCTLVQNLAAYPALIERYVAVLLAQPTALRHRLLREDKDEEMDREMEARVAYVMGGATRHYDETCISARWPALQVATAFANEVEKSKLQHFEREHMDVFIACLPPEDFVEEDTSDWLEIFEKVTEISNTSMENSNETLVQTWLVLYGDAERAKVNNKEMFHFLKEMQNGGEHASDMLESALRSFKENHAQEFSQSDLSDLFL